MSVSTLYFKKRIVCLIPSSIPTLSSLFNTDLANNISGFLLLDYLQVIVYILFFELEPVKSIINFTSPIIET